MNAETRQEATPQDVQTNVVSKPDAVVEIRVGRIPARIQDAISRGLTQGRNAALPSKALGRKR